MRIDSRKIGERRTDSEKNEKSGTDSEKMKKVESILKKHPEKRIDSIPYENRLRIGRESVNSITAWNRPLLPRIDST